MSHLWVHENMPAGPSQSPSPTSSYRTNVRRLSNDENKSNLTVAEMEEAETVRRTESRVENNRKRRSGRNRNGRQWRSRANAKIKMEIENESESSDTEVEAYPVEDPEAPSEKIGAENSRSHQLHDKQFADRLRWSHKDGASPKPGSGTRKGSVRASRTGRGPDRVSSPKETPPDRRRTVERLERGSKPSTVKMENGNDDSYGQNPYFESSPEASSKEDDNEEASDFTATGREQSPKKNLVVARKVPADAVLADSGKGRATRKRGKPKSSTASSAAKSPRSYHCEQCNRTMASAAAMHYHRRAHSGVKPYACAQCPRRFIIRGQLVEHERIHTGEKPFACDQCPKRFAQSNQLKQHASIHSDVGTHVCPTCGEGFARPWRLASHRRAAHDEDVGARKRYSCEDCGREYALRQSWVYHRLTHSTDKPFQCEACSKQFRVAGQLRQHANHCRGLRATKMPTASDPLCQPPQNWLWFSEYDAADLLAPTDGPTAVTEVRTDISMLDGSHGNDNKNPHPTGETEFHSL